MKRTKGTCLWVGNMVHHMVQHTWHKPKQKLWARVEHMAMCSTTARMVRCQVLLPAGRPVPKCLEVGLQARG